MAKKKWSFNAFVAGKNLKGSNKICDIGIEMDMRLCADADILIYSPDYPCHNTTDCFIEALKENKHDAVELHGLRPEHIADILPYLKDVNQPFGRYAPAQIEMKECRQTAAFLVE